MQNTICDFDRNFTDAFTGYPSSVANVRIFRISDIYNMIEEGRARYFPPNTFIIIDKAYPVMQWCVPPYINHVNMLNVEKYFNKLHAKARQVIERAFALLFGNKIKLNQLLLTKNTTLKISLVNNFFFLSFIYFGLKAYKMHSQLFEICRVHDLVFL